MTIAGLQKHSLIDYPGKVCCVLFVTGCNFTCPFCHNPELAAGLSPLTYDWDSVLSFLDERRGFLDGVVISGGEPTLWPDLGSLCAEIHALDLAVKLDTNGSRPDVIQRLLDAGRLDYVAMDIKTAPDDYAPPLCRAECWPPVKRSIASIMQAGIDYEFRTTCVRPFVDANKIRHVAQAIAGARRYVLQTFRPDRVLDREYFAEADPGFTPEQLAQLQAIVSPWVATCTIR